MESKFEYDYASIMKDFLAKYRYTAVTLSKELGMSKNSIYNITYGLNRISEDLIYKIINKHPEVSYWYLKTGKLPMALDNPKLTQTQANIFEPKEKKIDFALESFLALKNINETMSEQLEVLKEIKELLQEQKKANQ